MQYSQLYIGFSTVFILPLFGIINDKYSFKIMIKIISIGCIIHSVIISIFIKSNLIYLLSIIVGSILGAGFVSTINLHILKVYGIKYSIEIGGIIGIFSSVVSILNGILSFIISKFYHTGEELQYAYRYLYLFGICFCCLGFLLSLIEKETKFIYPFDNNEKDEEEYADIINSDESNKKPKEIELEETIESQ